MKMDDCVRGTLQKVISKTCQRIGFHSITTTSLNFMTDLLDQYLQEISKRARVYTEQFGRADSNLDDFGLAFQDLNIKVKELEEYLKYMESEECPVTMSNFLVSRKDCTLFSEMKEIPELERSLGKFPEMNMIDGQSEEIDQFLYNDLDDLDKEIQSYIPDVDESKINSTKWILDDMTLPKTPTIPKTPEIRLPSAVKSVQQDEEERKDSYIHQEEEIHQLDNFNTSKPVFQTSVPSTIPYVIPYYNSSFSKSISSLSVPEAASASPPMIPNLPTSALLSNPLKNLKDEKIESPIGIVKKDVKSEHKENKEANKERKRKLVQNDVEAIKKRRNLEIVEGKIEKIEKREKGGKEEQENVREEKREKVRQQEKEISIQKERNTLKEIKRKEKERGRLHVREIERQQEREKQRRKEKERKHLEREIEKQKQNVIQKEKESQQQWELEKRKEQDRESREREKQKKREIKRLEEKEKEKERERQKKMEVERQQRREKERLERRVKEQEKTHSRKVSPLKLILKSWKKPGEKENRNQTVDKPTNSVAIWSHATLQQEEKFHYFDHNGIEVWICPNCKKQDDGTVMIECDSCDLWYHLVCTELTVSPPEEQKWHCELCLARRKNDRHHKSTKRDK